MARILVVDDEKNIREGLSRSLEYEGYESVVASDGKEAIAEVYKGGIDLIIADLKMPNLTGEELLSEVLDFNKSIPVVILTGHGNIEKAVEVMRMGAYDFLTKPLNLDKLSLIVARALESRNIKREKESLEKRIDYNGTFHGMIGRSKKMQKVYDAIRQVADTKATVLIEGESGTGKELVAEAIHKMSPRANGPLIKVNCAALSEGVLESELFGHEKGSFTGASARKIGRFEAANKGTIFLDEIGEISASIQVKLLRVLEERTIERVGSNESVSVDIRVITATNKNLSEEVEAKRFREDLFYRLNVVKIEMPPLRERREDIVSLADSFFKEFSKEHNRNIESIEPKVYKILSAAYWEGNVRQLRNTVENMVVLSHGGQITENDIPDEIVFRGEENKRGDFVVDGEISLSELEKRYINHILGANKFNKQKAAKILGIERTTLYRKLRS